jgi:hypothetical protein
MKKDTQNLLLGHRVGKKTKKRQRKLDRALGVRKQLIMMNKHCLA